MIEFDVKPMNMHIDDGFQAAWFDLSGVAPYAAISGPTVKGPD